MFFNHLIVVIILIYWNFIIKFNYKISSRPRLRSFVI